ncbi:CoA-disulfide reductase [Staphylococcus debuckii]|uniref:CoA-disulfide reductase n=1 Tax=Staphylococcus debuckii TaxID=2044912 RepID=UPI000F4371BA|nr:CoA-disulfide reductase [Staphylococcus debuckii]AYU54751.1 CoA-disulfide reductase [Staphylococcus debuckii]
MTKVIVIGGVAGGATFASQLRRLDSECEITLFEKDRDVTFANCGLPYYLGNIIEKRSELLHFTPEQFKEKKDVTAKVFHEVIHVDPNHQTVTVKDLKNNTTFTEHYDYLVMSPGCRANRLPLDSDMIFTLRNLEDTDAIESYIEENNVQKALIVGAGYISLEVLENFYNRGIQTTLIHRSEAINKLMDQDMNQVVFDTMDEQNIDYRLNEEVESVDGKTVHFKSGKTEDFDIIIEGIGIKPNTEFLEDAGIEEDDAGYIPVNEFFQTNYRNVYAIGDIASYRYRHVDLPTHVPLAWGAHRAASIAAEHITQTRNIPFKGFLAANVVKFFDYTLASVGVTPADLKHFDYTMVESKQMNHAGYFPGAAPLHLRVYFEKNTRKIIRAAAVGKAGADKRIDILSLAMQNDMTVDELTEFETAYAPPYSSPKDIINMIGYKAQEK